MDPFVLALLNRQGFAHVRRALTGSYAWFLHASHVDNFDLIREHGLLPRNPGMRAPPEVQHAVGQEGSEIVCLRSIPTPNAMPVRGPAFMLALHRIALPERVGIDWSFGGWREHLRDIREGHTDWANRPIILRTSAVP